MNCGLMPLKNQAPWKKKKKRRGVSPTKSRVIHVVRESESGSSPAGRQHRPSITSKYNPARAWRNRDMSYGAVCCRKICCSVFAAVCVCAIVGVLTSSLKKVPPTEVSSEKGVWLSCALCLSWFPLDSNLSGLFFSTVWATTFTRNSWKTLPSGGLFIGPPGFRFIKFPSTFITVDLM